MVMPLRDCIARPDDDGRRFGLIEHLVAVAERCGRVDGSGEDGLAFLAGLLHDAAKAAVRWQEYIRGVRKKGPSHAPLGAALFAYWADQLVPGWTAQTAEKQRLFDLAADWTRVVYDHHGALHDLTPLEVPWIQGNPGDDFLELLAECDCGGLECLVRLYFPAADKGLEGFAAWLKDFEVPRGPWTRRLKYDRDAMLRARVRCCPSSVLAPLAEEGLRLAELGARLIFADRSHAASWDVAYLEQKEAEEAAVNQGAFCGRRAEEAVLQGASPELVRRRGELGAEALAAYRRHCDANLLSLVVPTGCGKTLAGLRVALEACCSGRCRRILYVTPYLSILSQAAAEIRAASGLEVFVHHHMTAAALEDHQPYDVLDTWQAPVLATTFNQLCRALFPRRAQHCLRIPALDRAFVLVDEPQIIDPQVWNLFLNALELAARKRCCQVLFLTATLPPTRYGLDSEPVPLVPEERAAALSQNRFTIYSRSEPWGPDLVAREAAFRLGSTGSVAVILNTVRDTVEVFEQVKRRQGGPWLCLTARMLPGHKSRIIQGIREQLAPSRGGRQSPVGVVSSQVIEAGVDLSFRSLLRARPIFSSVVQAAGRANRHAEGSGAEVIVFPYVRPDGTDSRPFVYGRGEEDGGALLATDALLAKYPQLPEQQVPAALREFYDSWWSGCQYGASLEQLERSARGEWSAVAGLTPFADDYPRNEVFVPETEAYLTADGARLLQHFHLSSSHEVLRRAQDPAFRRRLSFLDRKRFSALIRQFTVSVPERTAKVIASPTDLEWVWVLTEPGQYSAETGLALGPTDDCDQTTVII